MTSDHLLPPNATALERSLSLSTDLLTRLGGETEPLKGFKTDPSDSLLPWLIWEYGLGELLPYLPDPRRAIAEGIRWQRLRGTPAALTTALSWIGATATVEQETPGIHFAEFQFDPGQVLDEQQAAPALGLELELGEVEGEDAPERRHAAHLRGRGEGAGQRRALGRGGRGDDAAVERGAAHDLSSAHQRRRAQRLALGQRDEGLARPVARGHVCDAGQKAVAARAAQQQRGLRRSGKVMHGLRAGFELDQRGDGLAVAACAGQAGHGHAVRAPIAAQHEQRVHRAALKGAVQPVAGLEGEARGVVAVAAARTHPAFGRNHHGDGFIDHLDLGHGFFLGLDQRAARVGKGFGVGFDLLDHEPAQARRLRQDVFEAGLLRAQLREFLLDLDRLQPRELAQADFEDVLGLPLAQVKACHQRRLGLVARADDGDHLVDVQQHDLPPFEDVDAVEHLGQAVARAPRDGVLAEADPLLQHLAQAFLRGPAVQPHHGQVDGRGGFEAGVREQLRDELGLRDAAAFGLEHQAHGRVLARLVAHAVEHGQDAGLELRLLLRQGFFAGLELGVGELLDFFEHFLRAHAGWQLGHHELPLATRELLDLPARAHLEAAAARAVGVLDVGRRADDLSAARVVRAGQQGEKFLVAERGVFDQRHAGVGHFA